ncbi:MAG: methionine gamma-lyase family protein [Clostridiales bacterium]|jgi:cystathionine beta-lyase family protein involved in aluminum resistance|nr:methionine gamma-lyase family protein [Clostridiales bacterium]
MGDHIVQPELRERAESAERRAAGAFASISDVAARNQQKVIRAMQTARVSETHFAGSTGYGYGDRGRETLDEVYAAAFGAEAALVRHQITTGTQAIGICLFGNLRPGDELLSITGRPYDTLEELIGLRGEPGAGSLKDFGVSYREVPLLPGGGIDFPAARAAIRPQTKLVLIQRSRGYGWRDALRIDEIAEAVSFVKNIRSGLIALVDNCYGEFVEDREPTEVGADLIAGSLIKNPGGGLAPSGGYAAGKAEYVKNAAYRLTAPGLGGNVGPTLGLGRMLFQGFFMAPHVVAESLKGAVFCAALMEQAGFPVSPAVDARRSDIIQAVELGSPERLIAFCRGIQKGSAVDSFVRPEPWAMPGYEHPVIMAAGAFVQGSSIELSADGPVVPPYIAYMQGGLIYESVKIGCLAALANLEEL